MPKRKRVRLVNDGMRIHAYKELMAMEKRARDNLLSLAKSVELNTDLKLELMKYRGY